MYSLFLFVDLVVGSKFLEITLQQAPPPMLHDAQSRQQELPYDASTQQDTASQVGSKAEVPVPPGEADLGHPDRRLELAGLNALMKAAQADGTATPDGATAPPAAQVINWLTHKKEGMRLKRLMEESPDAVKFPHMVQMWNGGAADPCYELHWLCHE